MRHATLIAAVVLSSGVCIVNAEENGPWPVEKANAWQNQAGWRAGSNYIPANAINQLEMWQAETFDPATIDRELTLAEGLGFNAMRVFLHNIPWNQDKDAFIKRIGQYLEIADKHKIKTLFVLLDSCWDPFPKPGRQHDPVPHVHNSGWVQCPGVEILSAPARHDELKPYVTGIIGAFRTDPRVLGWDIFNEPDNMNHPSYEKHEPKDKPALALMLIKKAFAWAREARPEQPITSAPWKGPWADPARIAEIERFMFEQSDIVSFHCYGNLDNLKHCVANLRRYNRPILCSEFMSRGSGSRFDPNLGCMKQENVSAFDWGFVAGKTQTIYPWDSWTRKYTAEPTLWFHDIFRPDGTPYDPKETEYIRGLMAR